MKSMHKSAVALLAAGALALTACGGGDSNGGDEGGELSSFTIMAPLFSTTPPEEGNPVEEALAEIAGVDLDIRWVPNSDYGDRINTVLAGDDIPHAVVIQQKTQAFVQSAEAGGFWDLTEYVRSGDYPGLVSENPEVEMNASVNGKVYGIYRARDVIRSQIVIRKDWLENLGLEVPTTTDELREVARAFTEDDPDGNGQDDTYGIIIPSWSGIGNGSPYDAFDVWFGSGNLWVEQDGELIPSFTTPEWKQAQDYARDLIQSGYVNADYATFDGANWNTPFLNGEGGIIIDVSSRGPQIINLFRENDESTYDQYVEIAGAVEGPNGHFAMPTPGYAGFIAIPKDQVPTEEELKQVLQILSDWNSEEAQILMNNGIEGLNFEVEDGYAVTNPDEQALTDHVTGAYAQLGMNVSGYKAYSAAPQTDYDREMLEKRRALEAADLERAVFNPAAAFVSETYMSRGTQLDNIISDARIQYAAGQIDEAGLQAAIDQWHASGGNEVIAEMNELYAALDD